MRFCPNCGTKLNLVQKQSAFLNACPRCGYQEPVDNLLTMTYTPSESPIAVLSKREQELRTLPKVRVECPRCGYNEAFWWSVQIRGMDESSTQFFRCVKCGYTWRESS